MASILDVAKEAGVSTATVSRVLNGSYSVTQEKKDRVMAAVEKVGYTLPEKRLSQHIERNGPGLMQQGEKNILLIICSDFVSPIIHSFQTTAAHLGYRITIAHYDNPKEFDNLAGLISSMSLVLSGILLINCADNSPRFQELVSAYPMVQIGEPILADQPNRVVYTDEIRMAEDATDYMLETGRRKIGILTPAPANNVSLFKKKKRLNGYFLSLMNHGLPVDDSLVEFVDVSIEGGYEGTKKLLSSHPDLDAIIGTTDVMAQGAVYAIRRAGKTTDDVAIFSMDNNEVWDFTHTNFPYIDPHHDEMGSTAAHVLHAAIIGELDRDYRVVIRHTLKCVEKFRD